MTDIELVDELKKLYKKSDKKDKWFEGFNRTVKKYLLEAAENGYSEYEDYLFNIAPMDGQQVALIEWCTENGIKYKTKCSDYDKKTIVVFSGWGAK